MNKILIKDISKESLKYTSKNKHEIQNKGHVKMSYKIDFLNDENSTGKRVILDFLCLISSDEESLNQEVEESEVPEKVNIIIKFSHRIDYESEKELGEADVLYILEPYIRKEIFDIINELDLPRFSIPFHFWKKENEKKTR